MATKGMIEFRANGEDFTINDPNIAEEFDSTKAYHIHDHVYYQGDLYVFVAEHAAGAWNTSHVLLIKVGAELANLWNANATEATLRANADNDLKSALTYESGMNAGNVFLQGQNGYIQTGVATGTVVDIASAGGITGPYRHAVVECSEGDTFTITGSAGDGPRLWAYLDVDNKLISNASRNTSVTDYTTPPAPSNAKKIVININGAFCAIKGKTTYHAQNEIIKSANDLNMAFELSKEGLETFAGKATFVKGYIENGVLQTVVNYRIASDYLFTFARALKIHVASGYQFDYQTPPPSGSSTWGNSGWKDGDITIPANTSFKCMIARKPEDTTTPADIATFLAQVTFDTEIKEEMDDADSTLAGQITVVDNKVTATRSHIGYIDNDKIEILPLFTMEALSITTGEKSTSYSNAVFPVFLDNLESIVTSVSGLEARVFFYDSKSFSQSAFKGYVVQTLSQNTPYNIEYLEKGKYAVVLLRFTDSHNFSPADIQGKTKLVLKNNGIVFNPEYMVHNNLSGITGLLEAAYSYRYTMPIMFPIRMLYGVTTKTALQKIVLYDSTGARVYDLPYYADYTYTKEMVEKYAQEVNVTFAYFAVLFDGTTLDGTSYNFSESDWGTTILISSEKDDPLIKAMLYSDGYTYGGIRIDIDSNPVSYVKERYNIGWPYSQDGDCYGKYYLRISSAGTARIYNLITNSTSLGYRAEYTFTDPVPHANSAFFGTEKYNEDDYFPIFYANAYNSEDYPKGTLLGYRVQFDGTTLTLTKVQTITLGFTSNAIWTTGEDEVDYGNFILDTDRGFLFAYNSLNGNVNKTRFFMFEMPDLTESNITLTLDDVIETFDVELQRFPQGCCYYKGKIYALSGFGSFSTTAAYLPGLLNVVDLNTKQTTSVINLNDIGLVEEPETIFVYDGHIITGYLKGHLLNV